jgi:transcriptional regulator with XRE-family HTH domain
MPLDRQTIADRLRIARQIQDRTQADVGESIGYSRDVVSRIENCDRGIEVTEVATFAAGYNVPIGFFYQEQIDLNSIWKA